MSKAHHNRQHYFRWIALTCLLPFISSAALATPTHESVLDLTAIKETLYTELKEELYKDIYEEVHNAIMAKIETEILRILQAKNINTQTTNDSLTLSSPSHNLSQENLEQIVQETIQEVLSQNTNYPQTAMTDHELARIIAGRGIEAKMPIKNSIFKSPLPNEFRLALAGSNDSATHTSAQELDETVAGEEHPEAVERTLQQRGSVLLPKGSAQIEPSFSWSHFSSNRINVDGLIILDVFAIGEIATEKIRRDIFIQTMSLKYGLLNNFQAEIRVPFRGEFDRLTKTSSTSEDTSNTSGLGDINLAFSRQIGWEHGYMPDLILSLGVKPPTAKSPYNKEIGLGTGHWAVSTSLIAAKSSDPAVIFGSLSYNYNVERTGIEGLGDIHPGSSLAYSLGTAIALSYQTAINFSFDHSITFHTESNGAAIAGSFLNVANFKAGLNWAINEKRSVDFSISMGLTEDSPDLSVMLRFPYSF